MKLLVLLMLAALAAAATPRDGAVLPVELDIPSEAPENYSIVVNLLIRQFIEFLRVVIRNGWDLFNIPVLDPLQVAEFTLNIPAGLINLNLDLKNVLAEGFGGFVVHRSNLNLRDLTFDIDISFPRIHAETERYTLVGDLFTAIPLYGDGGAVFIIDNFRFQALIFLKQSDDGKSILIDRVENAGYHFPHFKSQLTGVIGGGDIDTIVNAITEEVIFNYVNRFQGAIASTVASTVPTLLNPFLDQIDSWRFIAPILPRDQN